MNSNNREEHYPILRIFHIFHAYLHMYIYSRNFFKTDFPFRAILFVINMVHKPASCCLS